LDANNQPPIFICRDSACRVTDSENVLAAVDRWFNPFAAPRGIRKTWHCTIALHWD